MRGRSEYISVDKLPPCFFKGIILAWECVRMQVRVGVWICVRVGVWICVRVGVWICVWVGVWICVWVVRLTSSSSLLYRAMSLRKVRTMMRAKIPEE